VEDTPITVSDAAYGHRHFVQFYEDDPFLIDGVAEYIGNGLASGGAGIVIATGEHCAQLTQALSARGVDITAATAEGRYIALDAAETLSAFMVDGKPDQRRFIEFMGSVIARGRGAVRGDAAVRAFGDMVALLWAAGQPRAALRLEELWNELATVEPFSLFCAYPMGVFDVHADHAAFDEICAQHVHVIPTESYTALSPADRLRVVSRLQLKARALDSERAGRQEALIERARLEHELAEHVRQLAEGDRRKDEFLVMLAHELRNPLSAVRNAVVTARLDESRRERALDIARRQTDQLSRLIDDLLDLARITQGRIALRRERISVADVVDRAVDATRAQVDARAHTLAISLPAEPVHVDADPGRLEQALANLLSNAAKYTERGGRIHVVVERDRDAAVVRVRDSGVGIAPDMLPHVFDLFAQGQRSLDRSQGGLGIGLTVVRQIIELHGGGVEARSDGIGTGAEFSVRLPALPADALTHEGSLARSRVRQRARVLIVEDNLDAAESLSMLLELLGHEVRAVHSGPEALDAVRSDSPDIALVDIGLPCMDGYQVAREMRALPNNTTILVALTGYGRDEDKQLAHAAGFDHHLTKPVEIDALERLVAAVGRAATRPLATQSL
jgi:signal transduction histidine kinase/ActR/RegA family two-component response regulator